MRSVTTMCGLMALFFLAGCANQQAARVQDPEQAKAIEMLRSAGGKLYNPFALGIRDFEVRVIPVPAGVPGGQSYAVVRVKEGKGQAVDATLPTGSEAYRPHFITEVGAHCDFAYGFRPREALSDRAHVYRFETHPTDQGWKVIGHTVDESIREDHDTWLVHLDLEGGFVRHEYQRLGQLVRSLERKSARDEAGKLTEVWELASLTRFGKMEETLVITREKVSGYFLPTQVSYNRRGLPAHPDGRLEFRDYRINIGIDDEVFARAPQPEKGPLHEDKLLEGVKTLYPSPAASR